MPPTPGRVESRTELMVSRMLAGVSLLVGYTLFQRHGDSVKGRLSPKKGMGFATLVTSNP